MSILGRSAARAAKIRVPASTSNLGAAFDAVGLALQLYLTLEVRVLDGGPSRLEFHGLDANLVPSDESNLIWQTLLDVAARHHAGLPSFHLRVENGIPITKGLGSSAAALIAGAAAADFLCGLQLAQMDLLKIAANIEGHPDNAAPSLWGGLVASIGGEEILCARAEFPSAWTVVAVTPEYELETKRARAVLPRQVPHEHAVFNVQRTAFLITQVIQGRSEGIRQAMCDMLHQPYRSELLPGLREVLAMEDQWGLLGVALSGAGPTVIAFANANEASIGEHIRKIFSRRGLEAQVRLLRADNQGLQVEPL